MRLLKSNLIRLLLITFSKILRDSCHPNPKSSFSVKEDMVPSKVWLVASFSHYFWIISSELIGAAQRHCRKYGWCCWMVLGFPACWLPAYSLFKIETKRKLELLVNAKAAGRNLEHQFRFLELWNTVYSASAFWPFSYKYKQGCSFK